MRDIIHFCHCWAEKKNHNIVLHVKNDGPEITAKKSLAID